MKYDVIVVGGGPGGSVAGKTAAQHGLKTLILERSRTPGDKNVSGTALSPKCYRDFDFIRKMDLPHMRKAEMATLHLVDQGNRERSSLTFSVSDDGDYPEAREFLAMNVYRSELDPWLADLAVAAGAELRCSAKVSDVMREKDGRISGVRTDGGEALQADIIIGADGVVSTVAAASGIREKWAPSEVAQIINVDFGANRGDIDLAIGANALHYWYSATFPVGYSFFSAEGCHIGLGSYLDWWGKNPHYYLQKLFEVEGVRKQIEMVGGKPREFQNHLVTFLTKPGKTFTGSVMLIGDAAGFACPYEAEGVYYAMLSGKIAADVAVRALGRGDTSEQSLAEYESAWWDSPIGEEFVGGESIEGFVRRLGFNPDAAVWIVPMLNEVLYSLCNVADSHTNNGRNVGRRLSKYLPPLVETLKDDLQPLATALTAEPGNRPSPAVSAVLRKTMPPVLRLAARAARSGSGSYSSVVLPMVYEHFLGPLVRGLGVETSDDKNN